MLAYNDTDTYTFVFVYDKDRIRQRQRSCDVGGILHAAGFNSGTSSGAIQLDLRDYAETSQIENPQLLELSGGEVFLECKNVPQLNPQMLEVQLGSMRFQSAGVFHRSRYSLELHDRLVACVETLIALAGFEFGFSLHLSDDEGEAKYRRWFRECVDHSRFSLRRLVHHQWLSIHSLAAGGGTLERYGREVFTACPAWRISPRISEAG